MSFAGTLARNVFSNGFGYVVNVVVALLLTPFVEDQLGRSAFGLWALLVGCTGYYGLLDAGIRSAVGQFVTRYWAKNDLQGVSTTLSTALALMLGAGGVVIVVGAAISWFSPSIFNIEAVGDNEARLLFGIVALGVAVNFPLLIFQSAAYARQRFDVVAGISIGERLLSAALFVWTLKAGHGLIGVAIVNAGVQLLANIVRTIVAFRLLPGMELKRSYVQRANVRELYGYSVFSVLINAGDQMLIHTSAIIIPIVMVEGALAQYAVGGNLSMYMLQLVSVIAWVLTPHATAQDAQGNMAGVRRLWVSGSRLILTFAGIIAGGIFIVGGDFLTLWMGPDYTNGEDFPSAAIIASILAVGALIRAAMSTGRQICFGLREVRFLARISFFEAALAFSFCFIAVWFWGIVGVAVGATLATAVTQLWAMPMFLSKRLDVPLSDFVRIPIPAFCVIGTMLLFDMLVGDHLPADTWSKFVVKAIAVAAPGCVVALLAGTTREEKDRVMRLFGRILPFRRSA